MAIYKISSFLTELLYREKIIEEDKIESCTYGIQITMANLINFAIAFGIGFSASSLIEISLFYVVFVSMRFFCGGYHAQSYCRCFSLFALTCFGYLVMLNNVLLYEGSTLGLLTVAIVFLGICIFVKAPVEHTNRPFTTEERKLFRKRSIQLYLVWSVAGIMLWIERLERLSAGFTCVFLIVAIYMMIEKEEKDAEEIA